MLAVSLSWVALYTFTPAGERPHISGSTNDSAAAMVFGYNGLSRVGIDLPGAEKFTGPRADPTMPTLLDIHPAMDGNPWQDPTKVETRENPRGWNKLFDGYFGVGVGWLYPLALLALVWGLWRWRRADRADPVRGGVLMWGVWLLTFVFVFSVATVPHTAYVASLARAVAALSGFGIVLSWRAFRRGGRQAWLLPAAIAAELAWTAWLWSDFPHFLPWLLWGALALGAAALVVLVLVRAGRNAPAALVTAALTAGVAAMLVAPATYAVSVLDPDYSGNSVDANAGPAVRQGANRSGVRENAGETGAGQTRRGRLIRSCPPHHRPACRRAVVPRVRGGAP